jgi:hypothetical protein
MKVWLPFRTLLEPTTTCFHPVVLVVPEVLEGSPQGNRKGSPYSFL